MFHLLPIGCCSDEVAMARGRDRHPDALPSSVCPSEEDVTFAGSSLLEDRYKNRETFVPHGKIIARRRTSEDVD